MTIANYTDLKASVASWLHRDDLTAQIPDFVTLAETRMSADINSRSMESRTSLTCTADGTLASRLIALPNDMLEMRRLMITSIEPAVVLEYKSPDQLVEDNSYVLSSGIPTCFTVIGANVELSPIPDDTYTLELIYKQRIPALSSNPTNWLLAQSPNAYLFGSLCAAAPFIQDDTRVGLYQQLYQDAIDDVNSIDWYSGSTLRVRAR